MYEAQLKSTVDPNHVSDWCQGETQANAKAAAKENYIQKYPNDNLGNTEYIVKPLHSVAKD